MTTGAIDLYRFDCKSQADNKIMYPHSYAQI